MRQPIELIQQECTSQYRLLKCTGCLQPPSPPKSASVQRYTETLGVKLAGEQGMKINKESGTQMNQSSDVPDTINKQTQKDVTHWEKQHFLQIQRTECRQGSILITTPEGHLSVKMLFTFLKQKTPDQ